MVAGEPPQPASPDALAEAEARHADLRQRLLALVAASGTLLGSPRLRDVLPAVLRLAVDLVAADAHAVWRLNAADERWAIASAAGISDAFAAEQLATQRADGVVPARDPIIAEDVTTLPALASRRAAYEREGIRSMLAVPLLIDEEVTASLVFYYRTIHHFTPVEIETARALGNLAAAAIRTAELYDQERNLLEQAAFLGRAGEALAASLDYRQTLKTLATLAVPRIADWCAVDMAREDGTTERLAVVHVDPEKIELAAAFEKRYPADPDAPYGVAHVIRTGQPLLIQVTDDLLRTLARDPEHLAAIQRLGITSVMIVPVRTRGEVLGAITFVSSESGRRYREADLRFAATVADRAAVAVENARAHEALQHANRLKDEFLATLSHELRTPLNAVMGYTRMLRTGAVEADRRDRALETIERNAGALAQIVEDVLDVSRIVAGKLRLVVEPVQLALVLDDAVATVLPAAEAKRISVRLEIPEGGGLVSGDADRLQQVFWNLMSNAVKFTPPGGSVTTRLERTAGNVEVTVSDTGRGIAPAFLPYIFDRFRQGQDRSAGDSGGLGLGLSIARNIIEMHGGTIDAESAGEGYGATFRISLPILLDGEIATAPPAPVDAPAPPGADRVDLHGLTVLVVDDEEDSRALIRAALESAGATVMTAVSASEALEQLAERVPDVMLSDLAMPGMDGIELIRRIRTADSPRIRRLPAAAVTAFARSEDRVKALRAGYQRHIAKPLDPLALSALVAGLAPRENA